MCQLPKLRNLVHFGNLFAKSVRALVIRRAFTGPISALQ